MNSQNPRGNDSSNSTIEEYPCPRNIHKIPEDEHQTGDFRPDSIGRRCGGEKQAPTRLGFNNTHAKDQLAEFNDGTTENSTGWARMMTDGYLSDR
jgi:hypothetical protein